MRHSTASALVAVLLFGCQSSPVYEPAPDSLTSATDTPATPRDPERPFAAVLHVLGYDLRGFDEMWDWLHEEVPESDDRDFAIGVAGLLGVSELSRYEILEEGLAALDRAALVWPADARLPLWAEMLRWIRTYRSEPTPDELARAYADLRVHTERHPSFTLFGLTMLIAADPNADQALLEEAQDAYATVVSSTNDLQFATDEDSGDLLRRLNDWSHVPYNLPATQAMMGDAHARAGDFDAARVAYYTALHTNAAYRWPFRREVERRLEDVESFAAGLHTSPARESMFGAGWMGAQGVDERRSDVRFESRIGNGTCTLCHTRLREDDATDGAPSELGWVRVRYRPPSEVSRPFPVFFALPDLSDDVVPAGFALGQPALEGLGQSGDDGSYDLLVPAPPGVVFVAGELNGGELGDRASARYSTYAGDALGMPRFVEVQAGQVTDITASPLQFVVAE